MTDSTLLPCASKGARIALPLCYPAPAIAVETSETSKMGTVSATYTSQASCPHACPFYRNGCYAEMGRVGRITGRLNRCTVKGTLSIARAEAKGIDALSGDRLLRLHVVGDARTDAAARELGAAARRYSARGNVPRHGRKVWTYTHAWRTVARESWGRAVSVLASCETVRAAREAMARGYAAAIVLSAFEREQAYQIDGITVLPCPQQTRGVTCRHCGLCRDDERLRERRIVIAFEAHGQGARRVRTALNTARNSV